MVQAIGNVPVVNNNVNNQPKKQNHFWRNYLIGSAVTAGAGGAAIASMHGYARLAEQKAMIANPDAYIRNCTDLLQRIENFSHFPGIDYQRMVESAKDEIAAIKSFAAEGKIDPNIIRKSALSGFGKGVLYVTIPALLVAGIVGIVQLCKKAPGKED